jgi:phosphatidylglycerophosphate synthase
VELTGTGDRRPIAARDLAVTKAVAGFLVRRRASPDVVSIAGMVAALLAGLCFAATPQLPGAAVALWLFGALLVELRLAANMLDGMVALGRGIASPVGELFNDVPDRVSDTAILLGLGVAGNDPALGLAAGLAAMATAYVRALGRSLGAPSEFCGPMAKPHRMALVAAFAVVACILPAHWTLPAARAVLWVIVVLALLTSGRRVTRVARHLRAATVQ